jgi:hypothetical protein
MAVGNIRPTVVIVATFEEGFARQLFVPGVAVDQRYRSLLPGVFVVMELIVFGIEQVNPGVRGMEAPDLLLQGDEPRSSHRVLESFVKLRLEKSRLISRTSSISLGEKVHPENAIS